MKIEKRNTTDQIGELLGHHTAEILIDGIVVARGLGKTDEIAEENAENSYEHHHNKKISDL